jgi:hypothetical protein
MASAGPEDDAMPRVELSESGWSDDERAAFLRRRRRRNLYTVAALALFVLAIYIFAMIKLHELGQMW